MNFVAVLTKLSNESIVKFRARVAGLLASRLYT